MQRIEKYFAPVPSNRALPGTSTTEPQADDTASDPIPKQPRLQADSASSTANLQHAEPTQPDPGVYASQTVTVSGKSKTLAFQSQWYGKYKWLHHHIDSGGVICFYCAKASVMNISSLSTKAEATFITDGFCNWKKALDKFSKHEQSHYHRFSIQQRQQIRCPVDSALSTQLKSEKDLASTCLIKILTTIQFLARQGLAFRGHENTEGNLAQLIQLRSQDVPELTRWMSKKTTFTTWHIQNEVLEMLSDKIVRGIRDEIGSCHYAIVVDGTQDCVGDEQESMCIRFVDSELHVHEEFIGFYSVPDTSAATISAAILDVLTRLQLPTAKLRGQIYDGAANMSGAFSGVQTRLKSVQPLALFVHCGAHCVNLVVQSVLQQSAFTTHSINMVHELGVLFRQSSKFRGIFSELAAHVEASSLVLKPLCPTRWTVRTPAILQTIKMYKQVCSALEQLSNNSNGNIAVRSRGLQDQFEKGNTLLGVQLAAVILEPLEALNRSMQGSSQTVTGMLKAVEVVRQSLSTKRNDAYFRSVYHNVQQKVEEFELDMISLPRKRRPPSRYTGTAAAHHHSNAEEHYRQEYFKLVDAAISQLDERFHQSDLLRYEQLESALISGKTNEVTGSYPELTDQLAFQLDMFRAQNEYTSLRAAIDIFRGFEPEVRRIYDQVEQLIRLCLVVPASSCEAERSFSALRRLKTWLRSTMSQSRLSHAAICHCHQERVSALDMKSIANEFISKNEIRQKTFALLN